MSLELALWFALSVLCDVAGQIFFKLGANQNAAQPAHARAILANGWITIGILIYAAEIFVWLRVLSEAPLSLAFPLASLNFLGITFASRLILKEKVGPLRIAGAVLVTFGVALLAATA